MRAALVVAMLVLESAGIATIVMAQQDPATGSRVRVTLAGPSYGLVTGQLIGADSIGLAVRPDHRQDTIRVERSAMRQLEVSAGRKDHAWTGLGIGAGIGLVAGVIGGLASGDDPPEELLAYSQGQKAVLYGAAGALFGGGAGMIVGALTHSERWLTTSPGAPGMTAIVAPSPEGVKLGLSLSF
jgi:hypothetical protein